MTHYDWPTIKEKERGGGRQTGWQRQITDRERRGGAEKIIVFQHPLNRTDRDTQRQGRGACIYASIRYTVPHVTHNDGHFNWRERSDWSNLRWVYPEQRQRLGGLLLCFSQSVLLRHLPAGPSLSSELNQCGEPSSVRLWSWTNSIEPVPFSEITQEPILRSELTLRGTSDVWNLKKKKKKKS